MNPANQPLLNPGQIFSSRYRVERFLAQGGMGAVFVAEHLATERRVALKVLFPQILATARAREGFELEAKVANRIQSEHVVQVLDAGVDDGTGMPFLVMELLAGKNLDDLVREEGPLAAGVAVAYLRQVASALDKAHGHRSKDGELRPIIHRDLKPENLFLTRREDGSPCVKILDFGLAKVLGGQTKVSQEVRGTPLFMAPEQTGGHRITAATDVWALGLIAFFLLSGRHYWEAAEDEGATVMGLFAEILSLPMATPSERQQKRGAAAPWPPAFDEWFFRCVNRDPARRISSAGEAIRMLSVALEGTGGEAARRPGAAPAMTALSPVFPGASALQERGDEAPATRLGVASLAASPAGAPSPEVAQSHASLAQSIREAPPSPAVWPRALAGAAAVGVAAAFLLATQRPTAGSAGPASASAPGPSAEAPAAAAPAASSAPAASQAVGSVSAPVPAVTVATSVGVSAPPVRSARSPGAGKAAPSSQVPPRVEGGAGAVNHYKERGL